MAVLHGVAVILLLILSLQVKRCAFASTDCIGLTVKGQELSLNKETFILSSLWQGNGGKFAFHVCSSRRSLINLLILMCEDIQSCPGPQDQGFVPELNTLVNHHGLTILHQNIRGLFSNKHYITELLQNFDGIDILLLSEMHITDQDPE